MTASNPTGASATVAGRQASSRRGSARSAASSEPLGKAGRLDMRIEPAVPVMSQLPQDFSILLGYWRSKKSGRLMPCRADIDPTELPGRLWPRLMLIDVLQEKDRNRFRYRLL